MDPKHGTGILKTLIPSTYAQQGASALLKRQNLVTSLLSERRLPMQGWNEGTIEALIQDLAAMDSNNFVGAAGVGEREARIACPLVARRQYRLAHGVGRSGDIAAPQPKAAGSSLVAKLANLLAADALRLAGVAHLGSVAVVPLATGMSITLTLLALRCQLKNPQARYVVWPRIDQKTCLKAIVTAGFEAVPVENLLEGDEVQSNFDAIQQAIHRLGAENIACVLTTTSCFAPRGADCIVDVAKLCSRLGIAHIINNAYGVQSAQLCALLTAACRRGRVDAFIQSTDKNFMVPVGGAIIAAPANNSVLVDAATAVYPGRASVSAALDLLITLLHWGANGWTAQLQQREALYPYLKQKLQQFAEQHGERVLNTPHNPISIGITLGRLAAQPADDEPPLHDKRTAAKGNHEPSFLGAMLFSRYVSGARVVMPGKVQTVAGHTFVGYGGHHDRYPVPYLTAAAALGTTEVDVDTFISKLDVCYSAMLRP